MKLELVHNYGTMELKYIKEKLSYYGNNDGTMDKKLWLYVTLIY